MATMANPARPRLLANRALAFTKAGRFVDALTDADAAIAVAPAWDKGHWRRGAALAGLKRTPDAVAAYHCAWQLSKGASGTPMVGSLRRCMAALYAACAAPLVSGEVTTAVHLSRSTLLRVLCCLEVIWRARRHCGSRCSASRGNSLPTPSLRCFNSCSRRYDAIHTKPSDPT